MKSTKLNFIKYLVIAIVPLIIAGGCDDLFDDGRITYDGPSRVEFKPLSQTLTLPKDVAGAISVNVQLIGKQRGEDLPLSFTVVDSSTTARVDSNYTIPSTSITIPADSSSTSFAINVSGANLEAGEVVRLVLELQGNSDQDIQPAENFKRYTLTLQGGG